jgi:predicted metal-binding protein
MNPENDIMLVDGFAELARRLGISACRQFDPKLLNPEQKVRDFCSENKCGNYGNHYMCPPHIGSLEEVGVRLQPFQRGILLQYSRPLDVKGDMPGLRATKLDFHLKVLALEEHLRSHGARRLWGMVGGSCELCDACAAKSDKPCPYPDKARTSLAAIGIDVLRLLDSLGLDNKFYPDKVTWTGCILL